MLSTASAASRKNKLCKEGLKNKEFDCFGFPQHETISFSSLQFYIILHKYVIYRERISHLSPSHWIVDEK
jgi:hypothetical protein